MIDKIIVIKYGGNAMINETLKDAVMEDIVALREKGYMPVLSHGGGPGIKEMQEKLGLESRFVDGLRYTDEPTLRVAEAVLAGQVGTELSALILKKGGKAAAISGVASGLYHCRHMDEKYGLVGEIDHVDTSVPDALMEAGIIPVVAPLGVDDNGQTYNINGDTAASLLAAALKADKLVLLTDIVGLCNSIEKLDVISYLNTEDVPSLKEKGVISGGMLPKIDGCVQAIESGVKSVHIIDGRTPHSLISLVEGTPMGTTIGTEKASVGIK